MTDASYSAAGATPQAKGSLLVLDERTRKRNAAEARFRGYGLAAILISIAALIVLLLVFGGLLGLSLPLGPLLGWLQPLLDAIGG